MSFLYKDKRNRTISRSVPKFFGGYDHYDSKGRKIGTSSEDIFGTGYTHYDDQGKKVGYSTRQIFGSGYNIYDKKGKKVGHSERKLFGGGYNYYDAKGKKTGESVEGCYIATCVYGSYDCPEVMTLRGFRDSVLKCGLPGRIFIRVYYAVSPKLVCWFGEAKWFRAMWRAFLGHLIKRIGRYNNIH